MSPKRAPRSATPGKRVPYRPRRDRRELWTAVIVASLIVIVTVTLVWFLRPNRESSAPASNPDVNFHTVPTTPPTAPTTAAPTDSTTTPSETTAPAGG